MKETVALELSFVNSNLQLLKEQLAELNSSVELYQANNQVSYSLVSFSLIYGAFLQTNFFTTVILDLKKNNF